MTTRLPWGARACLLACVSVVATSCGPESSPAFSPGTAEARRVEAFARGKAAVKEAQDAVQEAERAVDEWDANGDGYRQKAIAKTAQACDVLSNAEAVFAEMQAASGT